MQAETTLNFKEIKEVNFNQNLNETLLFSDEFENICEEFYDQVLNNDENYLKSTIFLTLENILKANQYFKMNKKMTIQMIATKTLNPDLFKIFVDKNYDVLQELDFTNSIGNNFLMMLNKGFYSNHFLFMNNKYTKWNNFSKGLQNLIFQKHLDKFNIQQVNIFGDNCFTIFTKNDSFIFNDFKFLEILTKNINNKKINIEDLNLTHCDKDGNTIIHLYLLKKISIEWSFLQFLNDFKMWHIFSIPNNDNITPLMLIFKFNLNKTLNALFDFNYFKNQSIEHLNINHTDNNGNNCLHYISSSHYFSKFKKQHIIQIYSNLEKLNQINKNNISLFVKLMNINSLFNDIIEIIVKRKDFTVFDYIEINTNNSALMYFLYFYLLNRNSILNRNNIMEILNYSNNHLLLKNKFGLNILHFSIKIFDLETNKIIMKKLNYDFDLYKNIDSKDWFQNIHSEYNNTSNQSYLYEYYDKNILCSIMYFFVNSYSQISNKNYKDNLEPLIDFIFNKISEIDYKYQDSLMTKTNDTYLILSTFRSNKFIVDKLLQICKNDDDYINHQNKQNEDFITHSIKNNQEISNLIIKYNLTIQPKLFEVQKNKDTLLIMAIKNNNIDMAYYLIKDNKSLSNDDLQKYIGSIVYTNYSYKSAFSEMALNENFYSGNLNKEKNKFIFQTILFMNLDDFKNNLEMFNKNYISKNVKLDVNKKSLKKAYGLFYQHYQRRYIKQINSQLDNFNIPNDLSSDLFNLFYVIH